MMSNTRWFWLSWVALGIANMAEAESVSRSKPSMAPLRKISTKQGVFTLGKKPYPPGTRDAWIAEGRVLGSAPKGTFPEKRKLKTSADNRGVLPPIGNQGSEGSCVHWAGTYAAKTANMKRMDPSINVNDPADQCSPRFTYNLCNSGQDYGGYGHEPFEIFMRYGVPSLQQKPYVAGQYTELPAVEDFVEGLHRRTTGYVWVWDWNPDTAQINELKAFLDAGGVAVAGVYSDQASFDAWEAGDPPWSGVPCTIDNIDHMVAVVGYGPGYYLIANSWGTPFGSNGFIHVAADYFENYLSDVIYPLEGTYEPATSYAVVQIEHSYRSDLSSLEVTVNGATVWSHSPTPRNMPEGGGGFEMDSRNDLQLAVDLSSAPWGAFNSVTMRCMDTVSQDLGTITNFSVSHGGQVHVSVDTPAAIPDNTGQPGIASVSFGSADQIAYVRDTAPYLTWFVDSTGDRVPDRTFEYAVAGDRPVVGDLDGDGVDDIAITRHFEGWLVWHCDRDGNGSTDLIFAYGVENDRAVSGDIDGDGQDDIVITRDFEGMLVWHCDLTGNGATDLIFSYGEAGDQAVIGDFDGDGVDDIAITRPFEGVLAWHVDVTRNGSTDLIFAYGEADDLGVAGNISAARP